MKEHQQRVGATRIDIALALPGCSYDPETVDCTILLPFVAKGMILIRVCRTKTSLAETLALTLANKSPFSPDSVFPPPLRPMKHPASELAYDFIAEDLSEGREHLDHKDPTTWVSG